ncbi:hypothetical protein HPP92_004524 [Vanilla planifolia]|uniref:Uncharacterized protein n=1 Tax=Vanilla planifolia TaxID=51239 RepID=A0A835RSD6_VANPL|nr:hypothetical protein HPP92_004524 [Vanilla planifolia]
MKAVRSVGYRVGDGIEGDEVEDCELEDSDIRKWWTRGQGTLMRAQGRWVLGLLRSVAIRLLCKAWMASDKVFETLQDVLDPKTFKIFGSARGELNAQQKLYINIRSQKREIKEERSDIVAGQEERSVVQCISRDDKAVIGCGFHDHHCRPLVIVGKTLMLSRIFIEVETYEGSKLGMLQEILEVWVCLSIDEFCHLGGYGLKLVSSPEEIL